MSTTPSAVRPESRSSSEGASYSRHFQAGASVAATPEALFAWLDDQARVGGHMGRRSPMMGGGRMAYTFDAKKGQAIGSRFSLSGTAFGLRLSVEQIVADRTPPWRKVWRTIGAPRLFVIGGYSIGFEILPRQSDVQLRIWIDYDPPSRGWARHVPALASLYARWCVRRMVDDAVGHFGRSRVSSQAS